MSHSKKFDTILLILNPKQGFIGIDEGLSALNIESYDKVCDIIRELKANMIFITSHQAGFAAYDSLIECELNSEGITEWKVSA